MQLQGPLANTLPAISGNAVFLGANSYIGNAPNVMVKSMAERQGLPVPSVFGSMGWGAVFLLPLFVMIAVLFFWWETDRCGICASLVTTTDQLRHTAALPFHKIAPNAWQLYAMPLPVYIR